MTFALQTPTRLKLTHSQSRTEIHGENKVPALDLRFCWQTSNRHMDMVAPGLRERLMGQGQPERKPGDAQEKLPLSVDELGRLLFPTMRYPLKFDDEHQGHTLRVEHGVDDSTALVVKLCRLHRFEVTPIEGGSAEIEFSVSSSAGIDEHLIGCFGLKQQTEVVATLLPASEVKQGKKKGDGNPKQGSLTPEQALAGSQG